MGAGQADVRALGRTRCPPSPQAVAFLSGRVLCGLWAGPAATTQSPQNRSVLPRLPEYPLPWPGFLVGVHQPPQSTCPTRPAVTREGRRQCPESKTQNLTLILPFHQPVFPPPTPPVVGARVPPTPDLELFPLGLPSTPELCPTEQVPASRGLTQVPPQPLCNNAAQISTCKFYLQLCLDFLKFLIQNNTHVSIFCPLNPHPSRSPLLCLSTAPIKPCLTK